MKILPTRVVVSTSARGLQRVPGIHYAVCLLFVCWFKTAHSVCIFITSWFLYKLTV
jgi:hypothetical protein